MTREALRALYDRAVDAGAEGLTPERAMAYRHACYLAWQRLDVPAIVADVLSGRLDEAGMLARVLPLVREALVASTSQPARSALH
jgi:hypothetical protein